MSDHAANVQGFVQSSMEDRISKAASELQAAYANGASRPTDNSVTGPTGSGYKQQQAKQNKSSSKTTSNLRHSDESRSANIDYDDEDAEMRLLREVRKKQLLNEHSEKMENLSKGHGQYRDITQDEFLSEVTNSKYVICHFYHRDFPRCKIMDHHLVILASRHIEAKFIKINAEKALFFVEKLIIRTIPTVVCFNDGVAQDKIIGFEGLADAVPEGCEDEWKTPTLARMLASKGFIRADLIIDSEAEEAKRLAQLTEMRNNIARSTLVDMDDDDFNLDNV